MKAHLLQLSPFPFLYYLTLFSLIIPHLHASLLHSDASALLAFKSKADLNNKLQLDFFSLNTSFCKWPGVSCSRFKVVRFVIENLELGGTFPPNTLTRLNQLRILSLQNNSLTGPVPDLSGLVNLKVLFLAHNLFSGSLPPSISSLHRLKTLDLSCNKLIGSLPVQLTKLDRLYYLRLDSNRFTGSIPPLNQSTLQIFNISFNNLTGAIPITTTLLRFKSSSFRSNPGLCGEILNKECHDSQPFFGSIPVLSSPPSPIHPGQNAQIVQDTSGLTRTIKGKQKRKIFCIGISAVVVFFIGSIICFLFVSKKKNRKKGYASGEKMSVEHAIESTNAEAVMKIEEENKELEEKVKRVQEDMQKLAGLGKSGTLVFCAGESQEYTLEKLMKASAELLGRGTMGTTYKAVLDNRLIVCVKRLEGGRLGGTSKEVFEQHMESVGSLRHPNLVPLRAYFQAKEERLLVYDYQPNGSLFSLIHGSKSVRAKPLHWTSCLKISEDIAQGLSYIHQAWRLVHGNIKSTNILLGSDFEACLTDYSLSVLLSTEHISDFTAYTAPEVAKFDNPHLATSKSDVYSYGILLIELLSGKYPSQHPHLLPNEMMNWVRLNRDDENEEENKLEMLLEVAMSCSMTSAGAKTKYVASVEDVTRDQRGKCSNRGGTMKPTSCIVHT